MKNSVKIKIAFIFLVALGACKKKSAESRLDGTWELRHVDGIQVTGVSPDYGTGNGIIIKFRDHSYEGYKDGKVVESGTFTTQPEVVKINNSQSNYSITFNKNKVYANISADKLILFHGEIAADGTQDTYIKL